MIAISAAALLALALLLPATAGAGVPQKEYACYGEANTYIVTLGIKSPSKYKYLGAGGKYRYHAGGRTLEFESGPLTKWVGRYYKLNGDPAIDIVTKEHGGQTVNCDS